MSENFVTLYVGNLPYSITAQELKEAFEKAGMLAEETEQESSVNIITDRMTGRSKGFAFIKMASEEDAEKAIEMWNEKELGGRKLVVNKARPRTERPPRD